ncbi:hypothetical protein AEQ58_06970, partial [Staphylococcus hominis]
MMEGKTFQFRVIDDIEEATFDRSLEKFYANGIEGTIKENLQNSLDAKLDREIRRPVIIKINLNKVHKSKLPGIEEVFSHIDSLKGGNNYTNETIEYMKKQKDLEYVNVLTIEDENTKGLSGAKKGQNFSEEDTFGIYAYRKGVHAIDSDNNVESIRGGSHGIGKIANNAISDINLMYFANCDSEGNKHVGGTVHLIEHKYFSHCYRSTGYFADIDDNNNLIPFKNIFDCKIFKKNTRGLKTIIPYIKEEIFNTEKILKAICNNFFLAILNESMVVKIIDINNEEIIINNKTINEIVKDSKYYETRVEEIKKDFTPLYIETYLKNEPLKVNISNGEDEFNFNLYFTYNKSIITGRVALLRTIGMKIIDLKIKNKVRKPFNAVLVGGVKEDNYLKSLENESHTDISETDIRDKKEKKKAKKFINNLNINLGRIIDSIINENNKEEKNLDTEDLFFEKIFSFKNLLEENTEKLELNNGSKIQKVKERKEKRNKKNVSIKKRIDNNSKNTKIRHPRKLKDHSGSGIEAYITPHNSVTRMSFKEKEILNIDINNVSINLSSTKCNLKLRIVDGSGDTIKEKFNIEEYYKRILDSNTNKLCLFKKDTIYNIEVNNNNIN